jgi:hypothetical protein
MDSDSLFDQLARRDAELSALASRGRHRSLIIMIVAFIPSPFVVMATNHDTEFTGYVPLGIAILVGISYSWTKWQRRPEDSQSVAFIGLDRKRRWGAYRSMWSGRQIEDPVVHTIVESIHHHLQRTVLSVVAAMVALAAATLALVVAGTDEVNTWAVGVIVVVAAGALGGHRWLINRSALVIGPDPH